MKTIRVAAAGGADLARKLRLSKPSVTSAIGTLERAGLVEREAVDGRQAPGERRAHGRGRRLVRKALDALHAASGSSRGAHQERAAPDGGLAPAPSAIREEWEVAMNRPLLVPGDVVRVEIEHIDTSRTGRRRAEE